MKSWVLGSNSSEVGSHCETLQNLMREICSNSSRNNEVICVVQDIRDLLAIESTEQFYGRYHVLGGIISPMEGIGPNDLKIKELENRV